MACIQSCIQSRNNQPSRDEYFIGGLSTYGAFGIGRESYTCIKSEKYRKGQEFCCGDEPIYGIYPFRPKAQQYEKTRYPCDPSYVIPKRAPPKYKGDFVAPRGVHDYHNLMWDPHVIKGKSFVGFREVEKTRKKNLDKSICKTRVSKEQWLNHRRLAFGNRGGILRPKTPPPVPLNLSAGTTNPIDTYLAEIPQKVNSRNVSTQWDSWSKVQKFYPNVPNKPGLDVNVQACYSDLVPLEETLNSIVDVIGVKMFEQAILEVMEEEETMVLRTMIIELTERHRREQMETDMIIQREKRSAAARERFMMIKKKHAEEEVQLAKIMKAKGFTCSFNISFFDDVLERVEREGFSKDLKPKLIGQDLIPWLNEEIELRLMQNDVSRDLLDDIIFEIVQARENEQIEQLGKEHDENEGRLEFGELP